MPATAPGPPGRSLPPTLVALGATAAVAVLLGAWLLPMPSAEVWRDLTPGNCVEYCEASHRCGAPETRAAIQQPANTVSNLAFVFVGFLAFARAPGAGSAIFAFSCLVLGIGSGLFHATVTREFQWLDVAGMYVALAAVAARSLHEGFGLPWRRAGPLWAGASALLVAFKWMLNTTLTMVFLAVVAAAGMMRRIRAGKGRAPLALLPLGLIAAGYVVRELDVRRVACDPESLLQGHAIWHLLSAASLHAAWRFFDAGPGPGPASSRYGPQEAPSGPPGPSRTAKRSTPASAPDAKVATR